MIIEDKKIKNGCTFLSGFAFKSSDFSDEGTSVIKIANIQDKVVRTTGSQKLPLEKISQKLDKFQLEDGDVLIAMTGQGSVGRVGKLILGKGEKALLNQRVGKFICDEKSLHKDFLYYVISSKEYEKYLFDLALGSGQPNLSPSDILNVEIPFPEYHTQRRIAEILSALDDKIELNRRMNQTLEKMAQTLFRQYFVDGIDEENLPEGWQKKRLGELDLYITDLVANGSFAALKENVKTTESVDYALFIRNTDLKSSFVNKIYVNEHSYNFLKKSKLFGGELILSNVGDIGSVHLCPSFDTPMTLGNNCIMIRSDLYEKWLYLYFKSGIGQHALKSSVIGSVQEKLSKTNFKNIELILPSDDSIRQFNITAQLILQKLELNERQNRKLTQLRDTLLPKLMSGEIDVMQIKPEELHEPVLS